MKQKRKEIIELAKDNLEVFKAALEYNNYNYLVSTLINKKLYSAAEIALDFYYYRHDYPNALRLCCKHNQINLADKILKYVDHWNFEIMIDAIDYCVYNNNIKYIVLFIIRKPFHKHIIFKRIILYNNYKLLLEVMNYDMASAINIFIINDCIQYHKINCLIILLTYYRRNDRMDENDIVITFKKRKLVFNEIINTNIKEIWEKRNIILFLRKSCLFPSIVQDYIDFIKNNK